MRKPYKAVATFIIPSLTPVIRWFELEETHFINNMDVFATRPCYKNGRLQGNGWRFTIVGKDYFIRDADLKTTPKYEVQQ